MYAMNARDCCIKFTILFLIAHFFDSISLHFINRQVNEPNSKVLTEHLSYCVKNTFFPREVLHFQFFYLIINFQSSP